MRYPILACVALWLACLPLAHAADTSWWNSDWSYRKQITLDTSAKGGDLTQAAGRIPLLVRLHSGNFQFDSVSASGADIRFIGADGKTPMNYQIETFDPVLGVAQIWLDVPNLPASGQQTVWMYYGNGKAPAQSSGAATFDANYTLVYHFDETSGTLPRDATAYANNALGGNAVTSDDGIVGKAARFDGSSVLTLPANTSLDVAAGGSFTFSAQVKFAAPATAPELIYARRQDGKALLIGLDSGGVPFVEIDGGQQPLRGSATEPLKAGQWTALAVTAGAGKVTLYEDGRSVATLAATLPAFTSNGATVGGDVVPAPVPVPATAAGAAAPATFAPFVGELDELRLSRIARSPAQLRAAALSENAESALIQYGEDEKKSGFGFGYFGIIVKSVTVDAWVIIGILLLMAVLSWVVMWQKGKYVDTVTKANDRFAERFRNLGDNMLGLVGEGAEQVTARREFAESSLFRLYQTGTIEVWRRRDGENRVVIASESIEAIRATMDSTLVRENQRLSKSMVLLTLAISGGPFIGLLGTVIGVMITFAAIAAAGDVNVNAIAPGIAAALLATVAGMFVAIPALFGYNYLLTRNKNVTANMQVFVDEFVTRLAELHRSADQHTLDQAGPGHPGPGH